MTHDTETPVDDVMQTRSPVGAVAPSRGAKYDQIDISSTVFWSRTARERDEAFAELRQQRPVTFHPPAEGGLIQPQHGFWAVVRYHDVVSVSRSPEEFCNGQGMSLEAVPAEVAEHTASFIVMDAPRHTALRRLVSKAFTPRNVGRIEEQIVGHARRVTDEALVGDEFDVVERLSTPLPLRTIAQMVGVPEVQWDAIFRASNVVVGTSDPDFVPPGASGLSALVTAVAELHTVARELAGDRRQAPQDDLMTALVSAEVDGQRLSDDEIGAFFSLLSVAGNDTTRNSISHGIHAFAKEPEQWALLRSDPERHLPGAVEEILRWATPAQQMRRTATRDTEVAGQPITEGDWVVLFYISANRDERVFDDPWRFDITRAPNEHIAFGGGGPHYCLGAQLARVQLRAIFAELAARVRGFEADEPQYLISNFIHGVKRLNCRVERA